MGISNIKRFTHWVYQHAGEPYLAPLLWAEQRTQKGPVNERVVEYGFALRVLSELGGVNRILDVGSGNSPWPALLSYSGYKVTAIDHMRQAWGDDYWAKRAPFNRHFRVESKSIACPKYLPYGYDAITCISTLEHIHPRMIELAMLEMAWHLRVDGHLILTIPCTNKEYIKDVWRGSSKFFTQSFTLKQVDDWRRCYFDVIPHREYYIGYSGGAWGIGERYSPPMKTVNEDEMNLGCFHYVKVGE